MKNDEAGLLRIGGHNRPVDGAIRLGPQIGCDHDRAIAVFKSVDFIHNLSFLDLIVANRVSIVAGRRRDDIDLCVANDLFGHAASRYVSSPVRLVRRAKMAARRTRRSERGEQSVSTRIKVNI
jgi:hypothetical protein